ncbi:MAG: hypothetical protein QGG72_14145, partial [Verrucomicrobiota bacterium]|nr:hypothetical protein [Verrucomicrobiota bacterium]
LNIKYLKKYGKKEFKHSADKTGKSKFTEARFDLSEGYILVICYDYSAEHGSQNHLSVSIDTKEFNKWAQSGIY